MAATTEAKTEAKAVDLLSVWVGGLPKRLEWMDVKDHMRQAGEVVFCELLYSQWGEPRGMAFVQYKTEAEAQKAKDTLNGSELDGKTLQVSEWTGKRPRWDSQGKQMHEMWAWWNGGQWKKSRRDEADPVKAPLIQRIKNYQKASPEQKESWYAFCGEIKDPARHTSSKLEEFITSHSVP